MKVLGGQMLFKSLKKGMVEKDYDVAKLYIWFRMLKDGMQPTKWLKPMGTGTKVNFDQINDEKQLDRALDELESFIKTCNREYKLDIKLNRTEG